MVEQGVPQVLGFRWDVEDDKAAEFAFGFYRHLLRERRTFRPSLQRGLPEKVVPDLQEQQPDLGVAAAGHAGRELVAAVRHLTRGNQLMPTFAKLLDWIHHQPAERRFTATLFDPPRDGRKVGLVDGSAFTSGDSYLSVRLVEMQLANARELLQTLMPMTIVLGELYTMASRVPCR